MKASDGRTVGRSVCYALAVLLSISQTVRLPAQDTSRIAEAASVLGPLIESYGVSGMEAPVRETVKRPIPPATCGCASARASR